MNDGIEKRNGRSKLELQSPHVIERCSKLEFRKVCFCRRRKAEVFSEEKPSEQDQNQYYYKIIQPTFDAEEGFKPMLVASKKSHHCHIPASQLMLLGMHKIIDRLPNLFPQWMSWQIAGDNMQALQNWKETPVVFIKIIKQFSYGIL